MKRFICTLLTVCMLCSCSAPETPDSISGLYTLFNDLYEFSDDGYIYKNGKLVSTSRYVIEGRKITMYSEDSLQDAMTFDFSVTEEGNLVIGKAVYSKINDPESFFSDNVSQEQR